MTLADNREKLFTYAFFALYVLGWIFGARHFGLALLSFASSSVCAFNTIPPDAHDRAQKRKQIYLVLAAFMLPALIGLWTVHQDNAETDRFRAYLAEHNCTYVGNTVSGYSKGGCDRVGNCQDQQEIEESEFFCSSTGNHITYSNFKAGYYGY